MVLLGSYDTLMQQVDVEGITAIVGKTRTFPCCIFHCSPLLFDIVTLVFGVLPSLLPITLDAFSLSFFLSSVMMTFCFQGHEIGHWKKNHNWKNFFVTNVYLISFFFLFGQFVSNQQLYEAFGFHTQPVPDGCLQRIA